MHSKGELAATHTSIDNHREGLSEMRKSLVTALAIVLAFAIAACGKGDNSASNGSGANSPKPENEPITITMLGPGNASTDKKDFNTEIFPELVKEKFPHVTIQSETLPNEQYITTLKARMATGGGPDIFFYWPKMQALDVVKPGYAKEITGLSVLDKFNSGVVDAFAVDGKQYAIPSGVNILGVYYNKSLFEQAGITEIPGDWEAFLAACQKLQDAGIQPLVSGDKDGFVAQFGLYQLAASIVYPQENDFDAKLLAGEQSFADPKWQEVLTKYKTLYDRGFVQKNSLGAGNTQAQQLFTDGKAAMTIDGNWSQSNLTQKGAVDFERGFFPLPGNDPGEPIGLSAAPSGGTFINAKTEHYNTIVQIMEYMYDGESPLFKAWVEYNVGQVPSYKGVDFQGGEVFDEYYRLFQTSPSWYFSNQAWPGGLSDELCAKVQEMISGKETVEGVAKAADLKLSELMAQQQ